MRATHIPRRPKKKPLRGKKVGFAEKKLRLWGIEAIDAIDAIDAIEGVEEIVWGIVLNRGTVPCQNFLVGVGGGEKK